MRNHSAITGDSIKITSADGTAPINGPKNGIIFVTPTITEISMALGNLNIRLHT